MLSKLVILWPVVVFSFISASQTVLICLILPQWLLQIWVRNHVCLQDPHVPMTNWEYVHFYIFIAVEDGLYSFLNRHGSLFKTRLSACWGVFIPIPHPTAFRRHVSLCPLDILISSWRIPYGIWRLQAAMPCGAFIQPSFPRWYGQVKTLYLPLKHHWNSSLMDWAKPCCRVLLGLSSA